MSFMHGAKRASRPGGDCKDKTAEPITQDNCTGSHTAGKNADKTSAEGVVRAL